MRALSIRQPWAWLIVRPDLEGDARSAAIAAGQVKDVENRTRRTHFRGRFLVHASQGMTRDEYAECAKFAHQFGIAVPAFDELQRGGFVGAVDLVDCLMYSPSRWYMGGYALVLRDARPLRFTPWKGQLGFFDVPYAESDLGLETERS